ncbi:hypothetical protein Droror1_Dr00026206 [Drosera rotundifolia]
MGIHTEPFLEVGGPLQFNRIQIQASSVRPNTQPALRPSLLPNLTKPSAQSQQAQFLQLKWVGPGWRKRNAEEEEAAIEEKGRRINAPLRDFSNPSHRDSIGEIEGAAENPGLGEIRSSGWS